MLSSANRLRKETDIKALFAKGKGVFDGVVGVKFRANGLPDSRFAVVVGHTVSKESVTRNRVKRRLREALRARLSLIKPGFDVMLLVRAGAAKATFEGLCGALDRSLKRAGLLV